MRDYSWNWLSLWFVFIVLYKLLWVTKWSWNYTLSEHQLSEEAFCRTALYCLLLNVRSSFNFVHLPINLSSPQSYVYSFYLLSFFTPRSYTWLATGICISLLNRQVCTNSNFPLISGEECYATTSPPPLPGLSLYQGKSYATTPELSLHPQITLTFSPL